MPLIISDVEDKQKHFNFLKRFKNKTVSEESYNSYLVKSDLSAPSELKSHLKSNTLDKSSPGEPSHTHISEYFEEDCVVETTALCNVSEALKSLSNNAITNDNYLTVPGTIKRGKKKGQSVEVILNMSREELEILEANMKSKKAFFCSTKNGIGFHILLWTIFCFPFSIIISGIYSFYIGTITWYNVFKFFSENKAVGCRIVFPPVLIVLYPFLIILISLGLGLYAGVRQLSCCWNSWLKEFTDYEKGFYGWLCNSLDIPECSPYEVVILSSVAMG